MTISEQEARELTIALSTAMKNNDKPAREELYKDLEPDDLKRILRWTIRLSIMRHVALVQLTAQATGTDPQELDQQLWSMQALAFTQQPEQS